jgi:hypothetical protein
MRGKERNKREETSFMSLRVFVDNILVGAAGTEERESVLGDKDCGKARLKRVLVDQAFVGAADMAERVAN